MISIKRLIVATLILSGLLSGCRPFLTENDKILIRATPTPEIEPVKIPVTCGDLDVNWGNNWPAALEALEQLVETGRDCGTGSLLGTKYAAHYIYGVALEEQEEIERAIEQYRSALLIDPQRQEALNALLRLEALPKPTPSTCLSTSSPLPDPAPAELTDREQFVTVQDDRLYLAGQPFRVKGVNYYPRHAPWERFLNEADPAIMAQELDLIQQAGFNALRIFLWYKPLFTCQPEAAIPDEAAFELVDTLFQLARERGLKLIVTLNDLPDLVFRPLYTDFAHYDAQTIYIVRRYRNEAALLAWDIRNAGDFDYDQDEARFSEEQVLAWLAHVSQLIREHDPYHLLSAGWEDDPGKTAPYVDILSFQHWPDEDELETYLKKYRRDKSKPLVLIAAGHHSWPDAPDDAQTEATQAEALKRTIDVVEAERLSGWVIWTAFDFVPAPGQPPTYNHFFGLWQVDLTPKPVLEQLPLER